jgi:iron complex transport system substrate-binding protein
MPCSFGLREAIGEGRRLFEHAEVMATPAAQAGRLYAVDAQSYFSRSGPRLVDGLELLGSVVHPEVFGAAPDSAVARLS